MRDSTTVYDLGDLTPPHRSAPPLFKPEAPAPGRTRAARRRRSFSPPAQLQTATWAAPRNQGFDLPGSMSLFVPGTGQMVRGDISIGFFFLLAMGCIGSIAWAVLATLDRLDQALSIVGLPRESGVWALVALYGVAALLHVGNVVSAESSLSYPGRRKTPHPLVSGLASGLCPGWGQVLNGDRRRAALFIGALWAVGLGWLLVSSPFAGLMRSLNLIMPPAVEPLLSAPVRWTLPIVTWSLAVYDAAASATLHRLR